MLKKIAIILIKIYQKVSYITPKVCRFEPSCSEYTRIAILEWGFFQGCWFGIKRIIKCHPFNDGGFDPVPLKKHHET